MEENNFKNNIKNELEKILKIYKNINEIFSNNNNLNNSEYPFEYIELLKIIEQSFLIITTKICENTLNDEIIKEIEKNIIYLKEKTIKLEEIMINFNFFEILNNFQIRCKLDKLIYNIILKIIIMENQKILEGKIFLHNINWIKIIDDEAGREFWEKLFGREIFLVEWSLFLKALDIYLNISFIKEDEKMLKDLIGKKSFFFILINELF